MKQEEKPAYIMAQAAVLNAEILGMQAENMQREALGQSMAYGEDDFTAAIRRSQCTHDAVVMFFDDKD